LEKTVAALAGSGKTVVLVLSSPETGYSVPQAAVRLAMVTDEPHLELPRRVHDAFARKATEMLTRLASQYPNVVTFNVADALCDSTVCQLIVENKAMLFDADHLTMTAARRVALDLHDRLHDDAERQ
jgi:hypothetical protein